MGATDPTTDELIDELTAFTNLSEREAEVMVHIADELERTDTAQEARRAVGRGLGIEPSTVDTYYRRALEKVSRAAQLLEIANNQFPEAIDEGNLADSGGVLKCPCGSTDFEHQDMGDDGFALVCVECEEALQVG